MKPAPLEKLCTTGSSRVVTSKAFLRTRLLWGLKRSKQSTFLMSSLDGYHRCYHRWSLFGGNHSTKGFYESGSSILGDLCTQEFARRWSLEQELGRKADKDCKVTECMARNTDFGWTRWVKMTVEKIPSYSIRLVFNKQVTQAQGSARGPHMRGMA